MKLTDFVHENFVSGRRVRVLCAHLADLIPKNSYVLDIGCGDGLIAWLLMQKRPDLSIKGIDVLVRPVTRIPIEAFDGQCIPHEDNSFDAVMLIDVLHHAENPLGLLDEALRVSRHAVIIKDHTLKGFLAGPTLRFMDRVGNLRHGVSLRYDYWPRERWVNVFASKGLQVTSWNQRLGLYPWPAKWVFERSLHFLARIEVKSNERYIEG